MQRPSEMVETATGDEPTKANLELAYSKQWRYMSLRRRL